jgi:hypothetical protein
MIPRAIRLTSRPEGPRCAYVISSLMLKAQGTSAILLSFGASGKNYDLLYALPDGRGADPDLRRRV